MKYIDNIELLSDSEVEELCNTPASKYDILALRHSNHSLRNEIQALQSAQAGACLIHNQEIIEWKESIENALYVEITNGSTVKKTLAQAIIDDRNDLKILRHLGKIYNFLTKHWVFTLSMVLIIVFFDDEILKVTKTLSSLITEIKSKLF